MKEDAYSIHDPFEIQDIIFALSDSIRIHILQYLSQEGEQDTTAIAKTIEKTTNSTLYHLNVLYDAGLITTTLKRKRGREVSHWSLFKREFDLHINLDLLLTKKHSMETYALRILVYFQHQRRPIDKDFPNELEVKEVQSLLNVHPSLAKIILDKLDIPRIVDTIYRKIHSDLLEARSNGEDLRLRQRDIQTAWHLDEALALQVFYKLIQSRKFHLDQNNSLCALFRARKSS
ncbi:MAG: helix-turn-helix domain-containing protein [Promethearchaeota archaeon]